MAAYARRADLRVRCVEFHSYAAGGHLMMPGHRDLGSTVSLSVLLADPSTFDGGAFLFDGSPVRGVGRGDGVLFPSERVHNVEPVTRGTRHALVLELWAGAANTHDRSR